MPSYTLNNSKELNTVSGSSTRTNEWKKTFTQKKIQISMYIPVCVNVCACVSVMCMYGCSSVSIIWILLWTKHGGSNVQTVRWCYSAGIRSVGASPASAVPTHTHCQLHLSCCLLYIFTGASPETKRRASASQILLSVQWSHWINPVSSCMHYMTVILYLSHIQCSPECYPECDGTNV